MYIYVVCYSFMHKSGTVQKLHQIQFFMQKKHFKMDNAFRVGPSVRPSVTDSSYHKLTHVRIGILISNLK